MRSFRSALLSPPLALSLLSGLGMFFFLSHALRGPDYESYFATARSLLFDGDILLINEFETLGKTTFITPTGYASVLANIGAALFWLPCFAAAHLTIAPVAALLGTPLAADGYSAYYSLWVNFGNWSYGLAGLLVTYRLARRRTARRSALLALVFCCFATPVFYYMTFFTPNTGMPSLFVAALFLALWERARRGDAWPDWLLLGALLGLAFSIAAYNAGYAAFALVTLAGSLRERRRWRGALRCGAAFTAGALVAFLPQLVAWQIQFGSPSNPYARQLEALQPALWEPLFSSYHGAFFYAPFLMLATAGLIPLWRRDRALAFGAFGALAIHLYAVGISGSWWAGASFGMRYFLGLTPVFALGAVALFERLPRRALVVVAALCLAWTYLLFLGIYGNGVSASGYYPLDQQLANQWPTLREAPRLLAEHWQPLKTPFLPLLLVPFVALSWIALGAARWLSARGAWRERRVLITLALSPLLVVLLLARAAGVGSEHLRAYQGQPDYEALPRGIGDPLDLSATYVERGTYYFRNGDPRAADDFRRAQEIVPSNAYALLPPSDVARVPNRLDWQAGANITLLGYTITPERARAGTPLTLALYWQAQSAPVAPFFSRIGLLDAAGNVLLTSDEPLAGGQLDFKRWTAGVVLRDQHRLAVPVLPIGSQPLSVRVRVIDAQTQQRIQVTHEGQDVDGIIARVPVAP